MSKSDILSVISGGINKSGDNIARAKVIGGQGTQTFYVDDQRGNRLGNIKTVDRTDVRPGNVISTGIVGDSAIGGVGVIPVRYGKDNNELAYTRDTSVRLDAKGNLTNVHGQQLVGWKLDSTGAITGSRSAQDLPVISLYDHQAKAQATTKVIYSGNLSANTQKLKGPGEIFKPNSTGLNTNIKADEEWSIIAPEVLGTSGIQQGDVFNLSTSGNTPRLFVYGGVAVSKAINIGNGFYGAKEIGSSFKIQDPGAVGGAGIIPVDGGLTIKVGGVSTTLTARTHANTEQNEFNSLQSLRDAIKRIPGLTARTAGNRLFIAGTDGDKSITFQDANASGLKDTLGLIDIPDAVTDPLLTEARNDPDARVAGASVKRFSTLKSLKDQMNNGASLTGLQAESVSGGLDIHAMRATSAFNISGKSFGKHAFTTATLGDNTEIGRTTVTITSPMHGLQSGDFIFTAQAIGGTPANTDLNAGNYRVNRINDDQFSISLICTPANMPAVAATLQLNVPNGNTWQKISGQAYAALTPAAIAWNAGVVELTSNGHGIATNDVVYISGIGKGDIGGAQNVRVPGGYYIATRVDGNTISIVPANNAAAVGGAEPALAPGTIRIQKMGVSNAGNFFGAHAAGNPGNFNMNALQSVPAAGGNRARVKVHLPNNNYSVNDYIKLTGFANNVVMGAPGNTITVRPDIGYKIVSRDANSVDIEIPVGDIAGVPAANVFATYDVAAGNVGPDFKVDHYSRSFSYLGLDQNKFTFAATYDANNQALGLFSGKQNNNLIFQTPVTVIDSLGAEHELTFAFAKLDNGRWAVEIRSSKNPDGSFSITTDRNDGVFKTGILEFDKSGKLLSTGQLGEPISLNWTNGAGDGRLAIDWGTVGGVSDKIADSRDGISQTEMRSQVLQGLRQEGGVRPGSFKGFEIKSNGVVTIKYDNGTEMPVYIIPIGVAANMAVLEAIGNGLYRATGDAVVGGSGEIRLYQPGEGVDELVPFSIELGNQATDMAQNLLEINDKIIWFQAESQTLSADQRNWRALLAALTQ